jgi:hypothetical protein
VSDENEGPPKSTHEKRASALSTGAWSNALSFTGSTLAADRVGKVVERFGINPEATAAALNFISKLKPHDIGLIHQRRMSPVEAGYNGPLDDETFAALAGMIWDDLRKASDQQHAKQLVDRSGLIQLMTHLLAVALGAALTAFFIG